MSLLKNLFGHKCFFFSPQNNQSLKFDRKAKTEINFPNVPISPLRFGPNLFCTINNNSNT